MAKRTNWTDATFKKRIYELYSDIEVIGEYINSSQPITVKCNVCNNIWNPIANNLIRGISHCPQCSKTKRMLSSRISQGEFIKRVIEINPTIEILGLYETNKNRIKCRCTQCGNEWSPVAGSLLQGYGCKKCAQKAVGDKRKTTHEEFVINLSKIRPTIEVLGVYDGAYTPVKCRCKVCNNIWMPVPHDILTRSGCPECSHSATSFIEQFILMSFKKAIGEENVFSRDKKAIGKELDIYIPNLKLAIEPGGWVFHKKGLKKDFEKRALCEQKGIRIITIYYGCSDSETIEKNTDILVYETNFSTESEFEELKKLVSLLFKKTEIECNFSADDWLWLKQEAYFNSRKTTTKEFVAKLKSINSNISVLGEYKSSSEKIKCQCTICGHIWNPQANCLLQGRGCPKCKNELNANRLRYSQEEFLEKIKKNNPHITPLEAYIDSKTKIKFRCSKCNYEWRTIPSILFAGSGCPNCAGRPKIDTKSFKKRMFKINPNIEVLGEYVNTDTKIKCLCKVCNNIWNPTPHDLQSGRGCPECGRKRKGKRKIQSNT